MSRLHTRLSKLESQCIGSELVNPPSTWAELYLRLINHVPVRPKEPCSSMPADEAYRLMTEGQPDPDAPDTPEAWWRWYLRSNDQPSRP